MVGSTIMGTGQPLYFFLVRRSWVGLAAGLRRTVLVRSGPVLVRSAAGYRVTSLWSGVHLEWLP